MISYVSNIMVVLLGFTMCEFLLDSHETSAGELLRQKMHGPISDTFLLPTSARYKILIFQGIF